MEKKTLNTEFEEVLLQQILNKQYGEVEQQITVWFKKFERDTFDQLLSEESQLANGIYRVLKALFDSDYQINDSFYQSMTLNKWMLSSLNKYSQFDVDGIIFDLGLLGKNEYSPIEIKTLLALVTLDSKVDIPWQVLFKQMPHIAVFPFLGMINTIEPNTTDSIEKNVRGLVSSVANAPVLSGDNIDDLAPICSALKQTNIFININLSPVHNWLKKCIDNFIISKKQQLGWQELSPDKGKNVVFITSKFTQTSKQNYEKLISNVDNVKTILVSNDSINTPPDMIYQGSDIAAIIDVLQREKPKAIVYDDVLSCSVLTILASIRLASSQVAFTQGASLSVFSHIDSFIDSCELLQSNMIEAQVPELSICIPTYNRAELLTKCLNHLLTFDNINLEVNVSNNGSSDHTSAVIEEFSKKFKNFNSVNFKNTVEATENYFSAMTMATKEYTFVVADDDLPVESELIKAVTLLLQQQNLQAVYGTFDIVSLAEPNKKFQNKEQAFSELCVYNDSQRKDMIIKHLLLEVVVFRTSFFKKNVYRHINSGIISWWFADKALANGTVAVSPFKFIVNFIHKNRFAETQYASPYYYFALESEVEGFVSQIQVNQVEKLHLLSNYAIRHCKFKYERCIDYKDYVQAAFFIYKGLSLSVELFSQYARHWNDNFLEHALEQYLNSYIDKYDFIEKVIVQGELNDIESNWLEQLRSLSDKEVTFIKDENEAIGDKYLMLSFNEYSDDLPDPLYRLNIQQVREKLRIKHYSLPN